MPTKKSHSENNIIGKRIRRIRKALKLNQAQFSQPIGIKGNTLSEIENGNRGISQAVKQLMIIHYSINSDFLETGEGEMFASPAASSSMRKGGANVEPAIESPYGKDEFLIYIDKRLAELEKEKPKIRAWFEVEFEDRFPEIIEGKKKKAELKRKEPGDKSDKDFIIRQQIADIKDALMIMGIKTGIFKEKEETEVNADTPIEQQVSGIRDTLNAVCIKMGLLEERRKEQVPIGFPCRRHSNDE